MFFKIGFWILLLLCVWMFTHIIFRVRKKETCEELIEKLRKYNTLLLSQKDQCENQYRKLHTATRDAMSTMEELIELYREELGIHGVKDTVMVDAEELFSQIELYTTWSNSTGVIHYGKDDNE